jgi:hypothetical protein
MVDALCRGMHILAKAALVIFAPGLALGIPGHGLAAQAAAGGAPCPSVTLAPRATGGPQIADSAWMPTVARPTYARISGPVVMLDEAHQNFHTIDGRFGPFTRLLRADGFRVIPQREAFTPASLSRGTILVIANAVHASNVGGRATLPTPSAFTSDEIAAVRAWVERGGALLLIADHMPYGGAATELGAAFGIEMSNAFATDSTCTADEFLFSRANRGLADHPITRGRNAQERVSAVRSFTGQAFRASSSAVPIAALLTVERGAVQLLPSRAWEFTNETPRSPAAGFLQGATLVVGRGRVAAFGEAAMFSAQVSGASRRPMGMNHPDAPENAQFLLNVMHWMAGLLPPR